MISSVSLLIEGLVYLIAIAYVSDSKESLKTKE